MQKSLNVYFVGMKNLRTVLSLLAILFLSTATAQTYKISGTVTDRESKDALPGVSIAVYNRTDSNNKKGTVTDADGSFTIDGLEAGRYRIKISYVGYEPVMRSINIDGDVKLDNIALSASSTSLKNVVVEGKMARAEQKGDTTQFNAGAFKTNPDANAEDLVTKMPGITTDNGTLKVNGENVKQVLVDGKPFFGDDPATAVKNLPAEVIDKIQVFDKLSDQAQFTGFDDGQAQKTINITTKQGKNNGQFGKIYAGYGTDNRYIAGGNVNLFKGSRRISIIGLSNNINQQNFNTEDLLGVVGTNSGQQRGGFGGMRSNGGQRGGGNFQRGGGGNDVSNFLTGQQAGIAATNALGINYSDNWGKKIKVSGSYFFNNSNTNNTTTLDRQYITSDNAGLVYHENSSSNAKNTNHRFNFRFEYDMDSSNSIIISPRLSVQQNKTTTTLAGNNVLTDTIPVSYTNNNTSAENIGYNFSNNILYRHKFSKKGRTLSLNLNTQTNYRSTDGSLYALNGYNHKDTTTTDQQYSLTSGGYTVSPNISYTEPISKIGLVQISYNPSFTKNQSSKATNDKDSALGTYTDLNKALSNQFDNTYNTQNGGISYRINNKKLSASAGVSVQYATLSGEQVYPVSNTTEKNFSSVLPNAMFNYRFSTGKNFRFIYRTNNNAPSISQLQNVVDNSNPLLLKSGNPSLQQDYQQTIIMRYGATNTKKATSFFIFAYANFANNYIGNATFIPTKDTTINNISVLQGSQLSMPVNLDGYFSGRTFITYGLPLGFIKSNLNLNGGANYTRTPAMINSRINLSDNYTYNGGLTLSSNISEKVDFTLSYTGNYSIIKNSIQTQSDNSYYFQTTSLKFNWIFLKGFVLNTNLNHTLYTGLSQSYNQEFLLWNAAFGYKFFKDRSLELKLSVYDILNQNRAINRTTTETYIEDSHTNVLQRYFMLNLTYTLRKFKM